jgi:ATP-dependent helicase HepA
LNHELNRLLKLKQSNPLVRDSEVEALNQRRDALIEAFKQPLLQLDSVRIMVNMPK